MRGAPSEDSHLRVLYRTGEGKDWLTTLLLCIFLGGLGVHRFYTGRIGTGVLMLLTAGGCGIWWLIDVIIIATGEFKDADGNPLQRP
jgi:TM2 domain-containing membrane protein YozV